MLTTQQVKQILIKLSIDLPLQAIKLSGQQLQLELGYPLADWQRQQLQQKIAENLPDSALQVQIKSKITAHIARNDVKAIPSIKNIIGVASGKGGVGKSTTTVNLALALVNAGAAVGILDADVYGPNQPHLLGVSEKPQMNDAGKLLPPRQYGLESMSMGYLVADDAPMVWRGPMISSALDQLLHKTQWSALDYLLVDLPPGTGDIPLTLSKKTPLSAVVMVTTPQDVALLDVRKAIAMFDKMSIPILGVIENMSGYVCQHCGHEEAIFGQDGGERIAAQFDRAFLGKIPLALSTRVAGDQGKPIVLQQADTMQLYQDIATKITALLAQQQKSYAHLFTNVAVEK